MVASLTRAFGPANLALAEDAVQGSLIRAFRLWRFQAIPPNPAATRSSPVSNRSLSQRRQRSMTRCSSFSCAKATSP